MALLKSALGEDGSWDINPKFPLIIILGEKKCESINIENNNIS